MPNKFSQKTNSVVWLKAKQPPKLATTFKTKRGSSVPECSDTHAHTYTITYTHIHRQTYIEMCERFFAKFIGCKSIVLLTTSWKLTHHLFPIAFQNEPNQKPHTHKLFFSVLICEKHTHTHKAPRIMPNIWFEPRFVFMFCWLPYRFICPTHNVCVYAGGFGMVIIANNGGRCEQGNYRVIMVYDFVSLFRSFMLFCVSPPSNRVCAVLC